MVGTIGGLSASVEDQRDFDKPWDGRNGLRENGMICGDSDGGPRRIFYFLARNPCICCPISSNLYLGAMESILNSVLAGSLKKDPGLRHDSGYLAPNAFEITPVSVFPKVVGEPVGTGHLCSLFLGNQNPTLQPHSGCQWYYEGASQCQDARRFIPREQPHSSVSPCPRAPASVVVVEAAAGQESLAP